jgi:alkylation response protein AidB-like acyl-CoA dehydrogenase
MRLLEAAAWADGSFGWALNLGAGANMFAAFLPIQTAKTIFNSSKVCVAGSGALSGKAEKVQGGYIINGMWKYASGASHASLFSFSCILVQNDEPIINEDGAHKTRSFIVPKDQVTIVSLWNSYGLKATASHNFQIKDVFVPDSFSFDLNEPSIFADGLLYKFPFLRLAEAVLAITISGMACHFIDLLGELVKKKIQADPNRKKDYPAAQEAINISNLALVNIRSKLYESVETVWLQYEKAELVADEALEKIKLNAKQCALIARAQVDYLYPLAGMDAIVPEAELNRVWRDIHTASQHILLSPFSD